MFTAEQTIRIENWKAQHNSLLSNIQDASEELGVLLTQKDVTEQSLKDIKLEVLSEYDKLNKILETIKYKERVIGNKQYIIDYQKDEIELLDEDKINKEIAIDKEIHIKEKELPIIAQNIKDAEITLDLIQTITSDRRDKYKSINKQVKDKIQESRDLDLTLSCYTGSIKRNQELFAEKYSEYQQILREIQQEVEIEKEKVELPTRLLEEREQELKKKENNFLILTLRWKKLFKKMFPNQEFKY